MAPFDPTTALLGGALIGLASVLLMLLTGRIAGISGILGGALSTVPGGKAWQDEARRDKTWRLAFIAGLIAAPVAGGFLGHPLQEPQMPASWLVIVASGLLVGFGARLGGGCTSGHGVCGIARLSARSLVATAIFMAAAAVTVAVLRHGLGG
jgi:uncharacterized membrane protein YedE/YeeE